MIYHVHDRLKPKTRRVCRVQYNEYNTNKKKEVIVK